jgi:hypothetical protein
MSTAPYLPRVDSLADKVCRYFVRVPDDEMLSREVASKYGTTASNVGHQLAKAVEAGYLLVDGSVYSAGPNLGKFTKALETHEQPRGGVADLPLVPGTPDAQVRRRGPHKPAFHIDVGTITIDQDVPIQQGGGRTGVNWPSLFDRMEVGHSFALPAEGASSVSKAITEYQRATGRELAKRKTDQGFRVWRTK